MTAARIPDTPSFSELFAGAHHCVFSASGVMWISDKGEATSVERSLFLGQILELVWNLLKAKSSREMKNICLQDFVSISDKLTP